MKSLAHCTKRPPRSNSSARFCSIIISMRELSTKKITEAVRGLCIEANTNLSADVEVALNKALKDEESPNGREILRQLIHNAGIARKEKRPICQDTGSVVVFIELGQEIRLVDGSLEEAVNEGGSR